MQSELPWNVAGIPPEARDAARAAARREGLSVGEWMTRRIMRGFPDAAAEERAPAEWRRPTLVEAPSAPQEAPHPPRESEEMLARVSRSEEEAQNAYKVLDQQLKTVAHRLETTERNQTENNRAMTQAATQINIAAREQAQAFEQMTSNVSALAERLSRVERHVQGDGTRDAVKALHEGLSRVADQIAQTANQSAAQISALAGNVDSLATQLAETQQTTEATAQAVETRFASIDERMRIVERTAFASADAIDHTMENVETLRAAKDTVESEVRQQSAAVAQIRDYIEQFSAHISANQNAHAETLARVEGSIAHLQTEHADLQTQHADLRAQQLDLHAKHADLQAQHTGNPLDGRLLGIEQALSDIMGRLEQTEHTSASTSGTVEQTLRELALGFETADRHNRENVRDLQRSLQETAEKIAAVEEKLLARIETAAQQRPADAAPAREEVPQPILDTPIFPEHVAEESPLDFAAHPADRFQPMMDAAAPSVPPPFPSIEQDQPAAESSASRPEGPSSESFLSAARRSANAAAAQTQDTSSPGLSGWKFGNRASQGAETHGKRYVLAGSIFGLAVAGALAGVVLNHGVGSPEPRHATPATISSPFAARPSIAAAKPPENGTPQTQPELGQSAVPSKPNSADTGSSDAQPSAGKLSRLTAPAAKVRMAPGAAASASAGAPAARTENSPEPAAPVQHLASLARAGDSTSQMLLGLHYLDGNGVAVNEAEAARWLARAAQQGQPLAQYRLGTLFERGRGLPADVKQAVHWYELAAKQGNRKAMHNLAVAFAEGSGEPKDPAQAAAWFARAANLGLADSQFNLAVLYERGLGVKQSLPDAYRWYLIAAAQGDAESKSRAEALATQLSESDRAAAQQAAAAFAPLPMNPMANSATAAG